MRKEFDMPEKAQQYLDIAGVIMLVLDVEGRIKLLNKKGCEILECTEGQVRGKDWFSDFLPESAQKETRKVFCDLITGKGELVEYYENMIVTATGKQKIIAWHNTAIRDENRQIIGTLSSGLDVTQQRISEQALAESEQRFRTIIESTPIGVNTYTLQPDDCLVLTGTNEAAGTILKRDIFSMIGKTIEEAFPELVGTERPQVYRRIAQQGGAYHCNNFDYPEEHRGGGGYHEIHAFQTSPGKIAVMFIDVTQRLRAQRQLQFTQFALDHSEDAAFWMNSEGRLIYVNDAACQSLGYTREELLQMSIPDIDPNFSMGNWAQHWTESRNEGGYRIESQHRTKDGRLIPVEVSINYVCYEGVEYHCSFVRDITERKRTQDALEKRLLTLTQPPLDDNPTIVFEDLFNLDEIQQIQDLFAESTGVASIITRPDGTPITQPSRFCELCIDVIRKTPKGLENCFKSDAVIGRHHPEGPIIQPCLSGGLWDAGASITVGGRHVANWLIGQVRDESQTDKQLLEYARQIGADEKAYYAALQKVPIMSVEHFRKIAQALFVFSNQLSVMAYQNLQQARFITERRRAEKRLRESENKHRSIFTSASDAIFIMDEEHFLECNPQAVQLFGCQDASEVISKRPVDFSPELQEDGRLSSESAREKCQLALKGQTQRFPWVYRRKDGSLVYVEVSLNLIELNGEKHIQAMVRDVTQQRLAKIRQEQLFKELQAKNEELESIVFISSHDLRSPLVNIRGFTGELEKSLERLQQLLAAETLSPSAQQEVDHLFNQDIPESMGFINAGNRKMDVLLSGLLRLSRVGTADVNLTQLDMDQIFEGIINNFRFRTRQIDLEITIDKNIPACRGDTILVTQIFNNLIENAIKYRSPDCPPKIQINAEAKDNSVVYCVKDNGIGIDPEHVEKVFEIFHRLNPDAEQEGEGLGLTIVRRLLKRLDGQIWIESEFGVGTSVYVELPGVKQGS